MNVRGDLESGCHLVPQHFLLWKGAMNASMVFLGLVSDSEAQASSAVGRVGWARTG